MPNCPQCNYALRNAPEDAHEWFRCEHCGAGLRLPSGLASTLYWGTTIGTAMVVVVLTNFAKEYFHGFHIPVYGWVMVITTAWTVVSRMLWKAKWSGPKLHDPYSCFGLSGPKTRI